MYIDHCKGVEKHLIKKKLNASTRKKPTSSSMTTIPCTIQIHDASLGGSAPTCGMMFCDEESNYSMLLPKNATVTRQVEATEPVNKVDAEASKSPSTAPANKKSKRNCEKKNRPSAKKKKKKKKSTSKKKLTQKKKKEREAKKKKKEAERKKRISLKEKERARRLRLKEGEKKKRLAELENKRKDARKKKIADLRNKNRLKPKRSIIRAARSSWILFVTSVREQNLPENAVLSFGELCQKLSVVWGTMSIQQRQPYIDAYKVDKQRYITEYANLNAEDLKILRAHKRRQKNKRKGRPKSPISTFMAFVVDKRQSIIDESMVPLTFQDIGRKLGSVWRALTDDQKVPYIQAAESDRERFEVEMKFWREAQVEKKRVIKEERLQKKRVIKEERLQRAIEKATKATVASTAATSPLPR